MLITIRKAARHIAKLLNPLPGIGFSSAAGLLSFTLGATSMNHALFLFLTCSALACGSECFVHESDLNGDGIPDSIVSESIANMGQGGGRYELRLSAVGGNILRFEFWGSSSGSAVYLEQEPDCPRRLWYFGPAAERIQAGYVNLNDLSDHGGVLIGRSEAAASTIDSAIIETIEANAKLLQMSVITDYEHIFAPGND